MDSIRVNISITKDEMLKWYRSQAKYVFSDSLDGRSIRFPVNILQPFVGHHGVSGVFQIEFTDQGKFRSISRLA